MNRQIGCAVVAFLALLSLAACGGTSTSTNGSGSTPSTCDGVLIQGVLRDSLTNQAVSRASAALESGTQRSLTPVYDFSVQQSASTDSSGGFRLCAAKVTAPSVVVITALDSSGKAYPPFVASVCASIDLGTILMGGCRGICGFEGQEQTSSPATIDGVISTTPIGKTGRIVPQYAMDAMDGTRNVWGLTMPTFNNQAFTFATVEGTCGGVAPFCTNYSFVLPTQQPITRTSTGYVQNAAPPVYMMYAVANGTPSCTPPFGFTTHQQDGTSLLTATPGVHLTASDINLTACQ